MFATLAIAFLVVFGKRSSQFAVSEDGVNIVTPVGIFICVVLATTSWSLPEQIRQV